MNWIKKIFSGLLLGAFMALPVADAQMTTSLWYPVGTDLKVTVGGITDLVNAEGSSLVTGVEGWATANTTTDVDPAVHNTVYFADTSSNVITITLPDVTSANDGYEYKFYKTGNTNDLIITTSGGTQEIGGFTSQTIVQESKGITVKANFADTSYVIIQDSRPSAPSSALTFYGLTEASGIGTYLKATGSTSDSDYSDTTTDQTTGAITGADQLIAGWISDEGFINGEFNENTVQLIGVLRKTAGNANAQFYTEIYEYDADTTETLLATSSMTPQITSGTYQQFTISALVPDHFFEADDRVLVKFYASKIGATTDPTYDIKLEGDQPARAIFPVTAGSISHNTLAGRSATSSHPATAISYDNSTSGLSATDVKGAIDELAGSSSPSQFDCTVGASGADYTTVGSAIAGSCFNAIVIDDTTETGDIALGANSVLLYIQAGNAITMGDYQFTTSGLVSVVGEGEIDYTFTSSKYLFSGTSGIITASGITIDNNSTTSNTQFADGVQQISGVIFELPNVYGGGVKFVTDGQNYLINSTLNGGGSSSYVALTSSSGISAQVRNIYMGGTFKTSPSVIIATDDAVIIDGIIFEPDQDYLLTTKNNVSNLILKSTTYGLIWTASSPTSSPAIISDSHIGGTNSSLTIASDYMSVNGISTNAGGGSALSINTRSRCRVVNSFFFGGITISTGDYNIVNGNTTGSSGTITISDAGGTGNIVTSNQTGTTISDSGTGTVSANNYEY